MITDSQLTSDVRRKAVGKERMYQVVIFSKDAPNFWINVPATNKVVAVNFAKEYAVRILGLPSRKFNVNAERVGK